MIKFIKVLDVIVVAVILICSLIVTLSLADDGAEYAVIYVNGNEYGRYSLDSDKKQIVDVSTEYGHNVVVIDKQKVFVTETDCMDKVEIAAGEISKPGQSLVCLPNRLVITVEGRIITDATAF